MKKCVPAFWIVILLLSLLMTIQVYAYEDTRTHPDLTKKAIKLDTCGIERFLKDYLGMPKGIDTLCGGNGGRSVLDLVMQGATNEDAGWLWDTIPVRAAHHFYNPLKDEAGGLNDFYNAGYPNLYWAWGELNGEPLDNCVLTPLSYPWYYASSSCNAFSWRRTRELFYQALTSAHEEERNQKFIYCYEALGRVLHLLQDVSVPAHVRNDFKGHMVDVTPYGTVARIFASDSFEKYLKDNETEVTEVDPSDVVIPDVAEFDRFKYFWDKEQYKLPELDVNATIPSDGRLQCGLSEYVNANFFSECAMFPEPLLETDSHFFPYPNRECVEPVPTATEPTRLYLRKTQGGDSGYLLALAELWWRDMESYDSTAGTFYHYLAASLDRDVYADYAARIIPRTIGYTAGLINYFFRGTLEIQPPAEYLYALVDLDAPDAVRQISQVKLRVKNTSPDDEELTGGSLVCVARYRKPVNNAIEYPNYHDVSHEDILVTYPLITTAEVPVDYSYSVSDPVESGSQLAGSGSERPSVEFTFTFDTDDTQGNNQAIPGNVFDLELQVIYKGTLGQEQDAVAVGRADVCEPMQIVLWNDMDWFSFLDEPLRSDPSGDLDHDGVPEYFFCGSSSETVSLTFFDPAISGGEPDPQIDFPVQPGTSKKYLLVQPSLTGKVRYKRTIAVGPILPSDSYLSEFPLFNQFFVTETEVLDGFGQDGSRYQNIVSSTNPGRHRGSTFHNLFGAGTYDHYGSDRVLEGDSLRVLHTEEWDLGGSRHALARSNVEPPVPGASGAAIPRLKLSEKPTKERRSSY